MELEKRKSFEPISADCAKERLLVAGQHGQTELHLRSVGRGFCAFGLVALTGVLSRDRSQANQCCLVGLISTTKNGPLTQLLYLFYCKRTTRPKSPTHVAL